MLKAYKYPAYPDEAQKEFFEKTFGCCRFVWNKLLEEKLQALKEKKSIPRITPAKYKQDHPFLKELDSLALANVQLQLEQTFRNYFKNKEHFGLPKLKRKKDKQSYTTNNCKVDFEKGLIYLPKLKTGVKVRFHRKFEGRIKSVTIVKTKAGKYYTSILVEVQDTRNKVKKPQNLVCGIDVGLKSFATIVTDKGIIKVESPKYLIKAEKRLKRLQRALARKQKGSQNWEKNRIQIAKEFEYIQNSRGDFLHKLSKAIIDESQVVVVESLNVKGLSQTHLAKHILDSSWTTFLQYLEYKAKWYNRTLIKVDRFYPSSKTCSVCGYVYSDLKLSDREWECPHCKTIHDRDINAATNLRNFGLLYVGLGQPEVTPVESAKNAR